MPRGLNKRGGAVSDSGSGPVRVYREEDRAEWLRLRRALWPEHSKRAHLKEMETTLGLPEIRVVLVAPRREGGLGGFLELHVRQGTNLASSPLVGYVEGWYVERRWRRQGVGARLMRAAEAWARERGLTEIASDTEVRNRTSVRAHRRLGFEESYRLVHFLKAIPAREEVGA